MEEADKTPFLGGSLPPPPLRLPPGRLPGSSQSPVPVADACSPGGLQAGSSTLGLGLGGGWNIGPHNMTAGIGIGLPQNAKANISVALDYSGGVEFRLVSSTPLECNPSQDRSGANYYISCKSTKSG